jgi:ATP synthase protein I
MAGPPSLFSRYLQYSTFGLELVVFVVGGLLLGQWLDGKLGTAPWLLLLCLLLGLAAAFRNLIRLVKDFHSPAGKNPDDPKP